MMATALGMANPPAGWADTVAPVTLTPVADASVSADKPNLNLGQEGTLFSDTSPRFESYLRFAVPADLSGRAVLRLWVLDQTKDGPKVRRYNGTLDEATITWNTRVTGLQGTAVNSGALKTGTWAEWDVTGLIAGFADVTLALVAESQDGVDFASRETDHSPELVVTPSEPPSSTTTTSTSTSTTTSTSTSTSTTSSTTTTTTEPPTTTSSSTTTTTDPGTPPVCRANWAQAAPMNRLASGLAEMSGFVASPVHREWAWGIRDSGNPASLYAIRPSSSGEVKTQEFRAYGRTNYDWEDLAYTPGFQPGTGHLWVLENVGNLHTGNRWIYQFEELDPDNPPPPPPTTTTTTTSTTTTSTTTTTTTTVPDPNLPPDPTLPPPEPTTTTTTVPPPPPPPPPPPATLVGAYQWAYPDVQVNTETMFVFDGDLVVVTKTEPTRVYRFNGPLLPFTVNVPTYVGTLPSGKLLSIAALSIDQRTIAFANHGKVDFYENRGDVHDLAALISNPVLRQDMTADNREGGAFFPYGSCDLILIAESKTLWRLQHR